MIQNERAIRDKQEERVEEGRRQKKAPWLPYDKLKAPDEGMVESQFGPSFDRHAALLAGAQTDVQRANLAIRLQQTYGNRYVQRLVESLNVQAKLSIGSPDDEYEREADRVADAVTRASASSVQRQAEEPEEEEEEPEEEEEETVQAKSSESELKMVPEDLEAGINAARGSGQPLPDSVRTSLEPRFGYDFGQVRIHTDAQADKLSQQLSAEAFTTGSDIFFKDGAYQPGSDSGRGLIAHELTHVVQQSAAPALQRQAAEAPAAEEKEKKTEGELVQTISRFEVHFVDDGNRVKFQVIEVEQESKIGEEKAEEAEKAEEEEEAPAEPPSTYTYGYIRGLNWAWESSADWDGGKLVPIELAETDAIGAVEFARQAINSSKLSEKEKAAAMSVLEGIAAKIPPCFTGRAPGQNVEEIPALAPMLPGFRKMEESLYKGEMNTGEYAFIDIMHDKIEYKEVPGGPPKEPEVPKEEKAEPEIDVKNPIIIDGFEFNKFDLPVKGEGRVQLDRLCNLDPDIKKGIVIDRITGHTDIVPVTRPGTRFRSLEELSLRRIEPVVKALDGAKFAPPKKIEAVGASEAKVTDKTATRQERAKDRKVVVYWHWEEPKT